MERIVRLLLVVVCVLYAVKWMAFQLNPARASESGSFQSDTWAHGRSGPIKPIPGVANSEFRLPHQSLSRPMVLPDTERPPSDPWYGRARASMQSKEDSLKAMNGKRKRRRKANKDQPSFNLGGKKAFAAEEHPAVLDRLNKAKIKDDRIDDGYSSRKVKIKKKVTDSAADDSWEWAVVEKPVPPPKNVIRSQNMRVIAQQDRRKLIYQAVEEMEKMNTKHVREVLDIAQRLSTKDQSENDNQPDADRIREFTLDNSKQFQDVFELKNGGAQPAIAGGSSTIKPGEDWPVDMSPYEKLPSTPLHQRANACILILCQNKDLRDMLRTIRMFEDRFNRRYKYPYVFINDVPFSDEFQLRIRTAIASTAEFGIVEPGTWEIPTWINSTVMDFCRKKMEGEGIMYGGSVPYRHMCRWYSGWFHRHALVSKYEWYWRLEPGVSYYCDITYDPFVYMENNDKVYGFTVALLEIKETIPSLWPLTRYYAYERRIENSTLLGFLADENGEYNGCHFWSNFEIARVDLWANPQYEDYFNYLDQWGGFYYERWGDAPVHSIYVALTQPKSRLHYFHDIGYKHDDFLHCAEEGELEYVCQCPEDEVTFDFNVGSCLKRWLRYPADGIKWTFDEGIGFDERGRPIRTYRSPNGDVVRLDGDRGFVWEDEDPNAWVDGREGVDWVWDWEIAYDDKTGGTKGSE